MTPSPTQSKVSLVFFGTGPVSRRCLEGISDHFHIEAVITKPDSSSPHGKPHPTPVKDWATAHNVPLHQPSDPSELTALVAPGRFTSLLGLVVDYGFLIPEPAIAAFPRGIINSHFSLLPQWRGADPITFAILSGQAVTGVSLMVIVPALDEGELIAQATYPIPSTATAGELTEALSSLSNQLLITHLPSYVAGTLKPYPQSTAAPATYSRKLTKSDGVLDWTKPAAVLEREVRAYLGWPGSRTKLAGADVIITAAHVAAVSAPPNLAPGTAFKTETGELAVAATPGLLIVDRLKPAGKRDMPARDFLTGHAL